MAAEKLSGADGNTRTAPRHIAFIMDGNGRWAKKRGMPREYGHAQGAKTFRKIVEYCGDVGVEVVTVYALSTENYIKRPKNELNAILNLFEQYLGDAERDESTRDLRICFIGDRSVLAPEITARMAALESVTAHRKKRLNVALNYGGRAELINAVNSLIAAGKTAVTEADIDGALYTAGCPEPDVIVRTGAERRISNFLLWQSAYSELYFTDTLWPDMDEREVDKIIEDYAGRQRRYGAVK
jgi:undecaprenyl diphosphate synthase